jgi:LysM repeat protein
VTAGDTLWLIARRYGASVATIFEANGLDDPNRIYVGQSLVLTGTPPATPEEAPPATPEEAPPAGSTHTVRPGETLFGIALRYGVKSDALAANNQLSDANLIRIGEHLAILSVSDTARSEASLPSSPAAPEGAPSASATKEASSSATPLKDAFRRWSSSYGVAQDLLEALTWKESNWQPSITGPGGHLGIGQLSPDTVEFVEERLLGLDLDPLTVSDGVQLAARYLRYLTDRTHSDREALAAWNQGLHGFLENGMSDSATAFANAVLEIRRIRS